jgi:hypothetical protein
MGVVSQNKTGGSVPGLAAGWPVNLVGGQRSGPAGLDPDLVAKILAAEVGIPTTTVTSLDGVTATITPTNHSRNSAARPARRSEADTLSGAGPNSIRSERQE